MSPYVAGAISGPFIGLVTGFAVAWFDKGGRLRQLRTKRGDR